MRQNLLLKQPNPGPEESISESMSARYQLSRGQMLFLGAAAALLPLGLLAGISPMSYLQAFVALVCTFYLSSLIYDLGLVIGALRARTWQMRGPQLYKMPRTKLPTYTVMVAMYKESAVLPSLVENLRNLSYPVHKLQIMLLLEEDDEETIACARGIALPPHIEIVLVPESLPRTKPKALNYGLSRARGEFCVIYDAEDCPEPDQLLKAVARFETLGKDVICLQAKLLYHNAAENILTNLFAAEYAKSFHLFVPGLSANELVVPLGGTSNHFRTRQLRAVGAWDPYNVTEDADLGVRIARLGFRVDLLDSVTLEAATSILNRWVKQRSRWIKGYMQTYLVHMRAPLRLLLELGPKRYLGLQMTLGVGPLLLLVNPFFWLLTAAYFITRSQAIEALFPPLVMFIGVASMILGNLISIYYMLLGAMIQSEHGVVKYVLLTPFYWIFLSVAAWRALLQLIFAPHYWEKTMHDHKPIVAQSGS